MPSRPPARPPRRRPPPGSVPNPGPAPGGTTDGPAAESASAADGPLIDRFEQWRESLEGRPGGDALPAPMLDGYLCGVLLQPRPVPLSRWWPAALDPDGDGPAPPHSGPAGEAVEAMRRVAIDRHAALEAAISARRWFDPWVIAPPADAGAGGEDIDLDEGDVQDGDIDPADAGLEAIPDAVREAVYPWVAGFAHAMACFQDLLELADPAAAEPQALLCQFLDADDLEDADALLELIETLEPPTEIGDAVEMLVRATLLLADITRPRAAAPGAGPAPSRGASGGPRRPGGSGQRRR